MDFPLDITPCSNPGDAGHSLGNRSSSSAPEHPPFSLYVGIITAAPEMLSPLLQDLGKLASCQCLEQLTVVVLDNVCLSSSLKDIVQAVKARRMNTIAITLERQSLDAKRGIFGTGLRTRPQGKASIATARTMLQRYVGELMKSDAGSFGWLLDDDMRIDARACQYLPWLPAFRQNGVDVLIGACEGVSPNPPLHGVQCRLFDLLHNLAWLDSLPRFSTLPDRAAENRAMRARFPDYYYDLSRKHTEHLTFPHWIEPLQPGESVSSARERLIEDAPRILRGAPFTRPLVTTMPEDPLSAAVDSVNRGGHTFVLNHLALTATPNVSLRLGGRETRRSDMLWAIVNRHHRRMKIKAVGFPVIHVGLAANATSIDIEKVQDELGGAAVYAALVEFLRECPHHILDFSEDELQNLSEITLRHRDRRLADLRQSLHRICVLRESLREIARANELDRLLADLDTWFSPGTFDQISGGILAFDAADVRRLIASLKAIADDYALSTPLDIMSLREDPDPGAIP
jgi:hypothetical protein